MSARPFVRAAIAACAGLVLLVAGCAAPTYERLEPRFPKLKTVVVAPFFNRSHHLELDGRQVAAAFHAELQQVQDVAVVPVGVAETAMLEHRITLKGPEDAAKLAELLDADAVVIGAITDYDPYMPPRLGLAIQVYASPRVRNGALASLESLSRAGAAKPDTALGRDGKPYVAKVRVFDSGRPEVVEAIKRYAAARASDERADGWESYRQRSDDFVRFCCYEMVRTELASPRTLELGSEQAVSGS